MERGHGEVLEEIVELRGQERQRLSVSIGPGCGTC
jgi:hypothetical protein